MRGLAARGAAILCFHRISLRHFSAWLEFLTRSFSLVSMDELVLRRERRLPVRGLLAVTFDDGWRDTCVDVAAICEAMEWPITIYLMASLLDGKQRFWFAELPALLDTLRGREIVLNDEHIDLRPHAAARTERRLIHELRLLPGADAISRVDRIALASGASWQGRAPAFVDSEFVRSYRDSRYVSFGSHTIDHQALCAQSEAEIERQMAESRAAIEYVVGREVRHFCYPYGDPASIGSVAPRVVTRHYRSAVTMVRGFCVNGYDVNYLPRIDLYPTDNEARLVAKMLIANLHAA